MDSGPDHRVPQSILFFSKWSYLIIPEQDYTYDTREIWSYDDMKSDYKAKCLKRERDFDRGKGRATGPLERAARTHGVGIEP